MGIMNLIDWIYPRKCVGCNRSGKYFCDECLEKTKLSWLICPMCNKQAVGGMTHLRCKRKLGLDGLMSLWSYKGLVRLGVQELKYEFLRDIEKELSVLIKSRIEARMKEGQNRRWKLFLGKNPVVIGVPLYWRRQNWRGFNQAEVIGEIVAKRCGLRMIINGIRRVKTTKPQVKLKKEQRRLNVRGVFEVNKDVDLGKRVILIDDVWTTGATIREIGKQLKRMGVQEVWGLTLAK